MYLSLGFLGVNVVHGKLRVWESGLLVVMVKSNLETGLHVSA